MTATAQSRTEALPPTVHVAALMVSYRSRHVIPRALRGIDAAISAARISAEVVVVANDDLRADDLPSLRNANVRVVANAENIGYSPAINLAAQLVPHATHYLIHNPDAVLEAGALGALIAAMHERQVAIAAPLMMYENGFPAVSERQFHSLSAEAFRQFLPFLASRRVASRRALRDGNARCVSGACMLVDGAFFRACGGFDERIRMYLEDVELCWQAHRHQRLVKLVRDARCVHEPGSSASGENFRSSLPLHLTLLAARVEFVRRRLGLTGAVAMRALMAIGAIARIAAAFVLRDARWRWHASVLRWAALDGTAPAWPLR